MTTTTVINAQSIGTSTNVGTNKFPQKTTAQQSSDRFFVEVSLTNGAAPANRTSKLFVRYASSSIDMTAAQAMVALGQASSVIVLTPADIAGGTVIVGSLLEPLSGAYVYIWVDSIPTQAVAQTLTVKLIEGP
jgi:hypothetical protein